MIDTLRVGIPLAPSQFDRFQEIARAEDTYQWVQFNPIRGDIRFRRVSGQVHTDGPSYHREIRWHIPDVYEQSNCYLSLEFSVPKFWYGHNIHLLYDFLPALEKMREILNLKAGLKTRWVLPKPLDWRVFRADVCYAWRFPTQQLAHTFLDSLKHLKFPRKKPVIYPYSLLFTGGTYSFKIYEKLEEFMANDRKELLKVKASLEWVDHLEKLAIGVLRAEATLRSRYLQRQGISTVEDLRSRVSLERWEHVKPPDTENEVELLKRCIRVRGGMLYPEPEPVEPWTVTSNLHPGLYRFNELACNYEGGRFTNTRMGRPLVLLTLMIAKFVGENAAMQTMDKVKTLLVEKYGKTKASRLLGFWLYVQKDGLQAALDLSGHNSYYAAKRDLKAAGVTLIESQHDQALAEHDREFMDKFRMAVPSPFVTNRFDDYRDNGSVLNIFPDSTDLPA